jgi:16S rRNA (guanine(966)-N(2))-methyltransferase RsmD
VLKIIAGKGRGRTLATLPKNYPVRPMLGRIKKSLFDILTPRLLSTARFLDLYAGTGSVGLEALSRGVSHVTFVEKDHRCLDLVRKNAGILGLEPNASFFQLDVLRDLSMLPAPYDIVFMGPPYVDEQKAPLALVEPTLANVARFQLAKPSGLIVAQHHKKEKVADVPEGWPIVRQETYGDSVVTFFRHQDPSR